MNVNIKKRVKKMKSDHLVNKRMDDGVYKLRREVMTLIYEIKTLVDLPRVEIRITDNHPCTLGQARMRDCQIWITEGAITNSRYDLRCIVYHEVLHAVYGVGHDDKCPLMHPVHKPISKAECQRIFKKYVNKK